MRLRWLGWVLCMGSLSQAAQALDLQALWDFGNPALSEQRFQSALAGATGDAALILQTQIARTYGLRKDFAQARQRLAALAGPIEQAGPEARARYALELGRTLASAKHDPQSLTPEVRDQARGHFQAALDTARSAGLDALAIDAIHMFAFLDTAPADQLKWGEAALEVVSQSHQRDARRWEPSVRNNMGYALHQLGRYDEALVQFEQALALREHAGDAQATRVARWMVGWTLRSVLRLDEALALQLRLESECDAAGAPDPYVFEELEALYQAKGDAARAAHYAQRKAQASAKP